jgi:hypothetical protein
MESTLSKEIPEITEKNSESPASEKGSPTQLTAAASSPRKSSSPLPIPENRRDSPTKVSKKQVTMDSNNNTTEKKNPEKSSEAASGPAQDAVASAEEWLKRPIQTPESAEEESPSLEKNKSAPEDTTVESSNESPEKQSSISPTEKSLSSSISQAPVPVAAASLQEILQEKKKGDSLEDTIPQDATTVSPQKLPSSKASSSPQDSTAASIPDSTAASPPDSTAASPQKKSLKLPENKRDSPKNAAKSPLTRDASLQWHEASVTSSRVIVPPEEPRSELPSQPSMRMSSTPKAKDEVVAVFNANTMEGKSMVRALAKSGSQVVAIVRVFTSRNTKSLLKLGKNVVVKVADSHDEAALAKAVEGADRAFLVTTYWERFDSSLEEKQAFIVLNACASQNVRHLVLSSFEDTKVLREKKLKSQIVPCKDGTITPKFEGMMALKKAAKERNIHLTHMITSYLDQENSKKSLCLIVGENGNLIVNSHTPEEV